jgi:negative regulator of sigma E activity
VKTPAGEFDALKLVKRKVNPEDRSTEIWLAADRHDLPVRILIVEKDGTRLDQVAVKISLQ